MSFFQRLVSYVINDVAVKALSNSRAFQRFALKTHYHVEDAKTMASTGADALKNSFENYAPKVKEFGEAFREEVARDMKKMKQKRRVLLSWKHLSRGIAKKIFRCLEVRNKRIGWCSVDYGPFKLKLYGGMFRHLSKIVLQPPKKVVFLSYWCFASWWIIILAVHCITCAFNALYAYCYWNLKGTYLDLCLEFYHIGMPEPYHDAIAIVHGIMSAIHGICILSMLGGSLRQNSLAFAPWSTSTTGGEAQPTGPPLLRSVSRVYDKMTYPCGLCGVNGKYFEPALVCREIVETVLQTVQAYRMSMLLPRVLLNRFYVVLLAANCWSSFVADSVFFGRDEARRRFACIVLDCLLDFMSSTGVQLLVLVSYVGDYNFDIRGFDQSMWYNDEWVARALNELRLVVVVSWSDLLSRTIFTLGLAVTTMSMKRLLWRLPRRRNRVFQTTTSIVFAIGASRKFLKCEKKMSAGPTLVEVFGQQQQRHQHQQQQHNEQVNSYTHMDARWKWLWTHGDRVVLRSAYLLFGVWGIAVLGFHIHASLQPTLPQCFMQVRPWAVSRPSCYLVGLDCHRLGISGQKDEVEHSWSEFDASTVVQLLIRHCPELEVPDIFTNFSGLHVIKMYNTTIVDWGESAAITHASHTELISLYLARVNMTDGLLPVGLQSVDFPQGLNDIEICVSNLRSLPDDLVAKWPPGGIIYVEYTQLTTVPLVLPLLQPSYLSVTGSPITTLPPEIFEVPDMLYISISKTNVRELPHNVTQLSESLSRIYLIDTEISFFWSWMDAFIEREDGEGARLSAAGSTYCNELAQLQTGASSTFHVPPSPEYSSILMNPAEPNRQAILDVVQCSASYPEVFYPLSYDDTINAISPPPIK